MIGMPVINDTNAYRRHLPHLEKTGRTYFQTFTTRHREILTPASREIALRCCVHDHERTYWLHCAVVMPDHVHMVFSPFEDLTLSYIMDRVKGASAHLINKAARRKGHLWLDESFDRIVRKHEDLRKKCENICANPVRAGFVDRPDDWPWLWREWVEGAKDSRGRLSST